MFVMRMLGEMSAANPASGSFSVARGTGDRAVGRIHRRLVVLGAALCRRRAGGHRRRADRHGLAPGHPGVGLGRPVHGDLPRHEPRRREELRRVRVLVRRAQGRRDHALPGAGPARDPRRAARHGLPRHLEPHRGRRFPAERLARASSSACSPPSSRTAAWRRSPSRRPSRENPVQGVAKAVRTAMWRIAVFYIGSMAVIVTLVPWDDKGRRGRPVRRDARPPGHPRRRGRS